MVNNTSSIPSALRVRPTAWRGVLVYLAYMAVFYAVFTLVGVDYMHVSDSVENVLTMFLPPTIAGFVLTVILVSVYGWWKPAIRELKRLPKWTLFLPIMATVIAAANMVTGDFSTVSPTMFLLVGIGCLMVGFSEETVNRGQLVVAFRTRFGETGVWLLTSLMFAVFHLPNIFYGVGGATYFQVFVAFGMGSLFYLTRRATGSLVFSMLLHAFWDFSSFTSHNVVSALLAPVVGYTAVIVVAILLGRERRAAKRAAVSA
ncbi:CPBP family intramembrane metalloprotease [Mycetocola lacteus]|uniref:CPBP family intramembrane metalloprotease n=1 Tax=Mycetocola lacteus TaxID=76637 RepID=A0A3L7AJL9_9MICO|nr:CPBP family intramembrane glutamic endopeptidase [Mycetocola lacteus]RLP79801.1 CPBP family intramembrane metalloprotease [Mycetocola lacteus]